MLGSYQNLFCLKRSISDKEKGWTRCGYSYMKQPRQERKHFLSNKNASFKKKTETCYVIFSWESPRFLSVPILFRE